MIYWFLACPILIALCKTIADIASVESHWERSFLKSFSKTGFFGPKNRTAERKDSVGAWLASHTFLSAKFANYLAHTILVPIIDIWHFSNSLRRLTYLAAITLAFYMQKDLPLLWVGLFGIINMFVFWLFYNYLFQRSSF